MSSIKAVANCAGVSTATVSRFFNSPDQLKEKTREKVLAAIKETGYSMNSLARNFRRGRSNLIVVVVPSIGVPHFGSVVKGIENVANEKGLNIMILDTQFNTVAPEKLAQMFFSNQADGIILLGSISPFKNALSHANSQDTHPPIIVSCETASPEISTFPSVRIDSEKAAFSATNHLISLGHEKIAFISGTHSSAASYDREKGYRAAMQSHNLPTKEEWVADGRLTIEDGKKIARRLLNSETIPTAILCANDEMALGAMHEIKQAGLNIPKDISIVGFDNIRYSEVSDPPLTTVAQPGEEIGEQTMYKLFKIIEGKTVENSTTIVPFQLIIRNSTASPAS